MAVLLVAGAGCTTLSGDTPVIASIGWHHATNCMAGTPGPVTITITISDPNIEPSDLTITGSVSSCTGTINALQATLMCPEGGDVDGSITVTDQDGNATRKTFTIHACEDGQA